MRFFLSGLLLLLHAVAFAQSGFLCNSSIAVQTHYGSFLTPSPKAVYVKDSYTSFTEIAFLKGADGSKPWHIANGFPKWGIAAFYGNTGSRQYIGHMGGLFPFIHFPLIKKGIYENTLRVGAGIALIEKPYDTESNHKNVVLGSKVNAFINFTWQHQFRISKAFYANAGLSLTHLSNGGAQLPNLGLNIPGITAGVRYVIDETKVDYTKTYLSFDKKIHLQMGLSAGFKQTPWIGSKTYLAKIITIEGDKQIGSVNRLGLGIHLFYDPSSNNDEIDPVFPDKQQSDYQYNAGFYFQYEHMIRRLSLGVQLGFYPFKAYYSDSFYENVGVRYQLTNRWSGGFYLKTHWGKAEYIHLGFTYKVF
ncbi:MAG: hypothetical protein C4329_02820 [Chitinophagaceae bacterium]